MFVSVEVERKAVDAYNKRKKQRILVIRRKALESCLAKILYVLFCVFLALCAYNLGLAHSLG